MRRAAFYIYVVNFLIGLVGILLIPAGFWEILDWWEILLYLYPLVLAFCGILIALWVWQDGDYIDHLSTELVRLKRRLEEKKILTP